MNIYSAINAPVNLVETTWKTACRHKEKIAAVTAVTAVATGSCALVYFLLQRDSSMYLKDPLMQFANFADKFEKENSVWGIYKGPAVRADSSLEAANAWSTGMCLDSSDRFSFTAILSTSDPDIKGLRAKVKELYSNATSFAWNLIGTFSYFAQLKPEQGEETLSAEFAICRSPPRIFSKVWSWIK